MSNLEKELVELYKDVYCFVFSRVPDRENANDITQSVMEIAIDKYNMLRRRESLKPWVMQIANNKIKAYYNNLKKVNAIFVTYEKDDEKSFSTEIYNVADVKADILELLVTEEDKINIMRALNELDTKYREVLRLNYLCDYNFIEISEILNVNVNTVRTWAARGLIKLKQEFQKIDLGDDNEAI